MKLLIDNVLIIVDCVTQSKINTFYLIGLGVFVLRIAVPVILLIFGILDLIKVVTSGGDNDIISITKRLGMKLVLAAAVFLLPTMISILLNITSNEEDKTTVEEICILNATSSECRSKVNFDYISDPEVCYDEN